MTEFKITLLPGDGIGPEVIAQAVRVLDQIALLSGSKFVTNTHLIGGCAIDQSGTALTDETLKACQQSDAVLLGAVGGPKWDNPDARVRPEQGLLALRKGLGVFANLRPVRVHPALVAASPLKPEKLAGVDMIVVRELTGGLYFGQPKGRETIDGHERAVDTLVYTDEEIRRVVRMAFRLALQRRKKVTSVDKANVLESSRLWRKITVEVAGEFPDVALEHTLVDTAGSPSVYVGDRPYFQDARRGRDTLVAGIIGRTSGKPICLFATPVSRPDGTFGGLVFVSVQLDALDVWLRETTVLGQGKAVLCDAEGRILAPSAAVRVVGGQLAARVSPMALAAGERGASYRSEDAREMLAVSVSVDRGGLTLVREEPAATALAGYRSQAMWVAAGALAAIILISPLVLQFCRQLEQPLATLSRHARELRSKEYDESCSLAAPPGLPREVEVLFVAFSEMACDVRGHIEAIEHLSVQDELTGLYNRRFLFSSGLKLEAAALRAGQSCCCLMLDVDHFKRVNDSFGHQAGDHVLAHIGALLTGAIRCSDLAARYGGEEFAVLLVGADLAQGLEQAERIRRTMAEKPCDAAGRSLSVTVSVGVAVVRDSLAFGDADFDDLLARADAALYAAKAAGRNRVMAE